MNIKVEITKSQLRGALNYAYLEAYRISNMLSIH